MRGILYLLDLRQIFPCAWGKKKKCQRLVGKSQHRKGRYELNDFYMALPVPRSSLGAHSPPPTACQICQDFQGQEAHLPSPHLPRRDRELQHCCPLKLFGWDLLLLQPFLLLSLKEKGSAEPLCKGDTGGR